MTTTEKLVEDLTGPSAEIQQGPLELRVNSAEQAGVVAAIWSVRLNASLVLIAASPTLADRALSAARLFLEHGPMPRGVLRWPRPAGSPYDEVMESPFGVASRLGTLGRISLCDAAFVIAMDAAAVCRRVVPFSWFLDACVQVSVGRALDRDAFVRALADAGYERRQTVAEPGEFSVRGGIVDVFSAAMDEPVRIELDADEVSSLRVFDAASQRSLRPVATAWVVPVSEWRADPEAVREAMIRLRDLAADRGVPGHEVARVQAEILAGRTPPAFSGMLASWHGRLDLWTAYSPEDALVMVLEPAACEVQADAALEQLRAEFAATGRRLCDRPEALFASASEVFGPLRSRPRTLLVRTDAAQAMDSTRAAIWKIGAPDQPVAQRVQGLCEFLREALDRAERVLIPCPTDSESRRVLEILKSQGLPVAFAGRNLLAEASRSTAGIRVGIGRVREPFWLDALNLWVVPSEAVFGVKDTVAIRRARERAHLLRDYRDLEPGSLVIHRDHGLGRFVGMQEFRGEGGAVTECLVLEYHGSDRLLVPVDRVHLLERYVAPEGESQRPLDRLGSPVWARRKHSARKAAREIAGTLKAIYARRLAGSAYAFSAPDADFREFEATFPYETTPDQDQAIEEVIADMMREKPMDRLVCGDVGFGKTEVAVRAAYKAAMDGKQVAVLVPTTILAEQHRVTFASRLRETPLTVETLSRFKNAAEVRRILKGLAGGGIDIVIGTHRLLSRDVVFKDLGLLIIDEEHRFGVSHKERLRELAATVHTLTLTATPIPRTLHMALSGIRDLSIIATPPRDRLAVKTLVARYSRDLVRTAVLRELNRGGQVFFVHNRVEDIYDFAAELSAMVPEARVTVAHGQMSATDLEGVMASFVRGDRDVLVCTTIIQSGLDIATANTMLIHRAETFGLADLYQLRGRVGRSSEQAWCYLLVDDLCALSEEARRRIEAIERFSELSSGFHIAALDLEIRGAGNLLGAEQSGHMNAVGYDLFMEMLEDAVREATGREVEERLDPEIRLPVEARIPAAYLPDEAARLRLYRRIAGVRDLEEVRALAAELLDRYGPPPPALQNLMGLMRLKVLAREAGVARVALKNGAIQFAVASGHEAVPPALRAAARGLGLPEVPGPGAGSVAFRLRAADAMPVAEALLQAARPAATGSDQRTR